MASFIAGEYNGIGGEVMRLAEKYNGINGGTIKLYRKIG